MYDENIFYKLSECAQIGTGYPLRGAVSKLSEGDTGLIQLRNVSDGTHIALNEIEQITLPTNRKIDYLSEGDIIFAARGTQNFAYYIPNLSFPTVCAPQFFVIKIGNKKTLMPKYLAWYLNTAPAQCYFESVSVGSAMKNIRRSSVENLEIPIPSLARQSAIVELWELITTEEAALKALIKNSKKLLTGLAQGLSKEGRQI